ncbi:hypothetical protein, partial [Klebsiella pneumoniae]|uniref:hypothetical protein n=1 Tax=Klebsiella pneumoniae TaxID=573 RepID=UPI0019684AC3
FEKQMKTGAAHQFQKENLLGYIYIDIRGVIVTYDCNSKSAEHFAENSSFAFSIPHLMFLFGKRREKRAFQK